MLLHQLLLLLVGCLYLWRHWWWVGRVGVGDGARRSRLSRPVHVELFVGGVGLHDLVMNLLVWIFGEEKLVDMPIQTSVFVK